ncbi:Cd2+/Zn2+-exporting ATPase OS=Eoetvoesiella caeni OX=645616 GN=DFR37_10783 PE=3 SV=1 [Eoetvoesiella caeni]
MGAPTLRRSRGLLPPEGAPFALGRPGGKEGPRASTLRVLLPPKGAPFALGRPGGKRRMDFNF